VQLVADKADTLSCLVWELALTRSGDAPPGLSLTQWANAVASRVNGLMEPLKVLEVDAQHGVATLRSAVPTVKHDAVTYYEVRLNGLESAVVRRYTASKTATGRVQLAFALTHEAIAKLAGDVAG